MSWFAKFVQNEIKMDIPKVIVETGTYRGASIPSYLEVFQEIHSIDLNESFTQAAREKFSQPQCHFHNGDSAHVLSSIIDKFDEPVLFYLDAHYSGGETSFGLEETPLLRELEVLSKRTQKDIICIDDARLFGRKGVCGGPNCPIYPEMQFDWTNITEDAIIKAYKRPCAVFKAHDIDRVALVPH